MRCYFLRDGHIAAVEILDVTSDEEAIQRGEALFHERAGTFAGFEIWDGGRAVYCSLPADAPAATAHAEILGSTVQ